LARLASLGGCAATFCLDGCADARVGPSVAGSTWSVLLGLDLDLGPSARTGTLPIHRLVWAAATPAVRVGPGQAGGPAAVPHDGPRPVATALGWSPMAPRFATAGGPGAEASGELDQALETHRRELTGFCYRMLGAGSEAEDAVQETMVRAWRSIDGFEGRSSLRSWLYRIANNVCIDMIRSPQRRARPMDMGPATPVTEVVLADRYRPSSEFVQPIADSRVISLEGDPADQAAARESVRLAFVAALQHLPPRQRSALILCDVLRWHAAEAAELLDTSVASVNSALQRARATLASLESEPLDDVVDPEHMDLLVRYVDAFERYDIPELVTLLRDDVVLSMPPYDVWLRGPQELADWFLGEGIVCKGGRLLPVSVNGPGGFGNYHLVGPGLWEPWAIQVIEVAGGRIVGHHNYLDTALFSEFGLPPSIEAGTGS
jgi:RNA polymerase sigma-70 factor, ECF subfamily